LPKLFSDIVAAHGALVDQLGQLVARLDTAGPGIGVIVDADLVQFGRVDAVEPVGDVAELDGIAVAGRRGGCQRGGRLGRRQEAGQGAEPNERERAGGGKDISEGHAVSLSIASLPVPSIRIWRYQWSAPREVRHSGLAALLPRRSDPIVRGPCEPCRPNRPESGEGGRKRLR
jgi:hypothetical protein